MGTESFPSGDLEDVVWSTEYRTDEQYPDDLNEIISTDVEIDSTRPGYSDEGPPQSTSTSRSPRKYR